MNSQTRIKNRAIRLCFDAMFIALYVVLASFLSYKALIFEISFQSLPILLCAFLFGPVDTVVVALCGSFIEQLLYGLDATTLLWMVPVILQALFVGLLAFLVRKHPKVWKQVVIIVSAELFLNIANSCSLYYCGYFLSDVTSPWLLIVGFATRTPIAIGRAILSAIIVPLLLPPLSRALHRQK